MRLKTQRTSSAASGGLSACEHTTLPTGVVASWAIFPALLLQLLVEPIGRFAFR